MIVPAILFMGLVFALCFGADKLFARLFRSRKQHKSGLTVRPGRSYAAFGLFLTVLGIGALVTGISRSLFLLIAGCIVMVVGIFLVLYYLCLGIYYDEDTFLYDPFFRKKTVYRYSDIAQQRLYVITGGSFIVELHMHDGAAISIQSAMVGSRDFLNYAFAAWCRQTGRDPENCAFHDPGSFRWFPGEEDT